MVIGIGTDLVEVERVRVSVERFGARFLDRVFTAAEQQDCTGRRSPAEGLAARFAAKEAAAKALGTGFAGPLGWRDIEVVKDAGGAPRLALHGPACAAADRLGVSRALLTLSHTAGMAMATVLLEGR